MSHIIRTDWEFEPPADHEDYIAGKVRAEFNFVRGCPEAPPCYSHGGLPAEPDEVDIFTGTITINGHERPLSKEELATLNTNARFRDLCIEVALDRG